jgi:NAD-dependent dihydropyrimidine dehydrogenase PreA subunit
MKREPGSSSASRLSGCRQQPGAFAPHIDRNRCEGKGDCVVVCPHDVFILDTLPTEARKGLSLKGRIKGWAHGWQQAFTPNADACQACGHCVSACPEHAITLVRALPRHNAAHHAPRPADR